VRPWTPHARIPTVRLSGRARYFAESADAAAVRKAVIHVQSMTAYGMPVSTSFSTSSPVMYGRPRAWFSG